MKKLIIANWKMNPRTLKEARVLASRVEHGKIFIDREQVETVLCPPAVFLPAVKTTTHFVSLGAQNIAHETEGAFTGEISAVQMRDVGVRYAIVGHSERRTLGEDDQLVNQKIKTCLKHGLIPVLCVGFGTKKSHNKGTIKRMIGAQIQKGLNGFSKKRTRKVIVAYEPVWAISKGLGTGRSAPPEHAREMMDYIYEKIHPAKVLYGGSVDAKNARSFAEEGIEGVLVGGASLDAEGFLEIIKAFGGNGTL